MQLGPPAQTYPNHGHTTVQLRQMPEIRAGRRSPAANKSETPAARSGPALP